MDRVLNNWVLTYRSIMKLSSYRSNISLIESPTPRKTNFTRIENSAHLFHSIKTQFLLLYMKNNSLPQVVTLQGRPCIVTKFSKHSRAH